MTRIRHDRRRKSHWLVAIHAFSKVDQALAECSCGYWEVVPVWYTEHPYNYERDGVTLDKTNYWTDQGGEQIPWDLIRAAAEAYLKAAYAGCNSR